MISVIIKRCTGFCFYGEAGRRGGISLEPSIARSEIQSGGYVCVSTLQASLFHPVEMGIKLSSLEEGVMFSSPSLWDSGWERCYLYTDCVLFYCLVIPDSTTE